MATTEWTNSAGGDWTSAGNWSAGAPTAGTDATIGVADGYTVTLAGKSGAANSLTINDTAAALDLSGAASLAIQAGLTNSGTTDIDTYNSSGGSDLAVGGTLSNTGNLNIGWGGITVASTVSAAGLVNSGNIDVFGNTTNTGIKAVLDLAGAAGFGTAGVVSGVVQLNGQSLIDFGSGGLTSIASGGRLSIITGNGFVAVGAATTSNSALSGLASNAGELDLAYGAAITASGPYANSGTTDIDTYNSSGGSDLAVGGTLSNTGNLNIGWGGITVASTVSAAGLVNSGNIDVFGNTTNTGIEAVLDLAGAAGFGTAGVVSGTVQLNGQSLIDFGSGGLTSIASGARLSIITGNGFVAVGAATTSNSALTGLASNAGELDLQYGAAVTASGPYANSGTTDIDTYNSSGGSDLAVGGTLSNTGNLNIGWGGITVASTVSAAGLVNSGNIDVFGNTTNTGIEAVLDLAGAAGFGTAGVVSGVVQLNGQSLIDFGSGGLTSIASGGRLSIITGNGFVAVGAATTSNSALSGLASNAGELDLAYGAAITASGPYANSGTTDIDTYNSSGGSDLAVGGTLSNTGNLNIGWGGITVASTVSAAGLVNSGNIDVFGNTTNTGIEAVLDLAGAAGFGTAGVVSGTVQLNGQSLIDFGSGGLTSIASGARLSIITGNGFVAVGAATTSNSALTGLASNAGELDLQYGAAVTASGPYANSGTTDIDTYNSSGGSDLAVGGTLSNTGNLNIGWGGITVASTVSAAGLVNSGNIDVFGNTTNTGIEAVLDLAGAAGFGTAGVVSGVVQLNGQSLIDFGSGGLTSIASGGRLSIITGNGFVAVGAATTSNSALSGLASNAGELDLAYGAAITASGPYANSGTTDIDTYNSSGGSDLAVGGTLSNTGNLNIGWGGITVASTVSAAGLVNSGNIDVFGNTTNTGIEAVLDLAGAAGFGTAGVVSGVVQLNGQSLIDFGSGGLTSIASGARLSIITGNGFVAVGAATTSNSALTGLASNAGELDLEYGAAVTASGPYANSGTTDIDTYNSSGGSNLAVGGTLSNTGNLNIGWGGITVASTVSAAGLVNSGNIDVFGNTTNTGIEAVLDLAGAAGFGTAGVVSGTVQLNGQSLIDFASGGLTSIASGGRLSIITGNGFVAVGAATTSNSALSGLASNAGELDLQYGAAVTASGPYANSGTTDIDTYNSSGGSDLAVGGTLSNTGNLNIGWGGITVASTVSAAGLVNSGNIDVFGNTTNTGIEAVLDLAGAAGFGTAGVVSGTVQLNGQSLIDFASGGLTSIASGGRLSIITGNGFVAVGAATTSNSALTGLASNAGELDLQYGAAVTASGPYANSGTTDIDTYNSSGGSDLAVGGTLSNTGNLNIGWGGITVASTVSAAGLVNTGVVNVQGNTTSGTTDQATLDITGSGTDTGAIVLSGDAVLSAGSLTVQGGGTLSVGSGGTATGDLTVAAGGSEAVSSGGTSTNPTIAGGTLELASGAVASGPIAFTGSGGTLKIDGTIMPANAISGFVAGDTLDLSGIVANELSYAGGVLTLTNGATTVGQLTLATPYADPGFTVARDGSGGTLVTVAPQNPSGPYTYITNFTKTNDIQTGLIKEFPGGLFVANNSFATPFDISSNAGGDNFYDGGGTITINVSITGTTDIFALINAYHPPPGASIATIEFKGSLGADETFTLVDGTDVRDFFQGDYADTINGTTTQNSFIVQDVQDAGGTGNVNTGDVGTYRVDEQEFVLDPVFATQTLTSITFTDLNAGAVPALLGLTALSGNTITSGIVLSNPATQNPTTVAAGGYVTNQTTARNGDAVYGTNAAAWNFTNLGTINAAGAGADGVFLSAGGTVTNGAANSTGAVIAAAATGVQIDASAGTVTNFGTIASTAIGTSGDAVFLGAGGTVTNYGLIIGARPPVAVGTGTGHAGVVTTATIGATVKNFGTITSNGTNDSTGINLLHGGVIVNGAINNASALISGSQNGIYGGGHILSSGSLYSYPGAVGTVVNYGTIQNTNTGASDVRLVAGGSVTNHGLISGPDNGISVGGTTGIVVNFGTIAHTGAGTGGEAVYLGAGGTVTNYGLISGARAGTSSANGYPGALEAHGQAVTVRNFGTIGNPNYSNGVNLLAGGTIVNGSTVATAATISGSRGGVYIGGTLGTPTNGAVGLVFNYGTIQNTGTPSASVALVSGGSVINHGLIASTRTGIAFSNTAGMIANFGTIVSTAPLAATRGAGGYLGAGGLLTNAAGASIDAVRAAVSLAFFGTTGAAATVTNSGTLLGNTGVSIGAGDSGANTIVNFGAITGTGGTAVSLGSGDDQVVIEQGSALQGAVGNFHPGDTFDLPFLSFSGSGSVTLGINNVLQIVEGSGTFTINLDPAQSFAGDFFHLAGDGGSGTLVTENQSASAGSKLAFFAGSQAVNLGLTPDGSNLAAPVAGDFNIEVFTATAGSLAAGYQAAVLVPGAAALDSNEVQSATGSEELLAGSYLVIDRTGEESLQIVGNAAGGSSITVVGSLGDTIAGSTVAGNAQLIEAIPNADAVSGPMTIIGGAGATTVWGGAGDSIAGGAGAILVDGHPATAGGFGANDTIAGGGGAMTVYGAAGDSILGGAGALLVNEAQGLSGRERIAGGAGSLTVFDLGRNDTIGGSTGGTTFIDDSYGAGGGSLIAGGSGSAGTLADGENTFIKAAFGDTVTGGADLTLIDATAGGDSILGGAGTVTGAMAGLAVAVNTLIEGGGGDTIVGGVGATYIDASAGAQTVAGSGATTVLAGRGDKIAGGAGALQVVDPNAGGSSSIAGGSGNLTVFDIGRSDTITGSTAGTTFVDDAYPGAGGASLITAGGGTVSGATNPAGGAPIGANTWIIGQAGDTVVGGSGSMYVDASSGSESVTGGSSTLAVTIPSLETASGGSAIQGGNLDTITGGSGTLQLYINSDVGAETVNLGAGHGAAALRDIDDGAAGASTSVTGFNTATDVIQSRSAVDAQGVFLGTSQSNGSGGTILTFVDGSTMTLAGIASASAIKFTQ